MTKIGTFHLLFLLWVYFYYFSKPFIFWIFGFGSILVLPIFIFILRQIHQHHFYSEFLRFITLTRLHMQMGHSFLSSCDRTLEQGGWRQGRLMKHIIKNVAFSQHKITQGGTSFDQFVTYICEELGAIKDNQHQAIDRLCNFQNNLRDRVIFRHKSRQIWLYFSYQVGILSVIYLGLSIYIVKEYGLLTHQKSFLMSFVFYCSGLLWVYWLSRGKKWSI